jgi:hypothetical protein
MFATTLSTTSRMLNNLRSPFDQAQSPEPFEEVNGGSFEFTRHPSARSRRSSITATGSRLPVPSFPRIRQRTDQPQAEAGIQVLCLCPSATTLDARRSLPPTLIGGGHDGLSLRLKAKQDSAKCEPSEHEHRMQRQGQPSSSCPPFDCAQDRLRRASRLDWERTGFPLSRE